MKIKLIDENLIGQPGLSGILTLKLIGNENPKIMMLEFMLIECVL